MIVLSTIYMCCFFFFFSSRRRHTRWPRDWSSDVCSSDLISTVHSHAFARRRRFRGHHLFPTKAGPFPCGILDPFPRSEERRVGKECRSRWWPYHEKEKNMKTAHEHYVR